MKRKIVLCVAEAYAQTKLIGFLQFGYIIYKVEEFFAWAFNPKV